MQLGNCLSRKFVSEMQILLCCFFYGFTYVGQKQANNRGMDVYSFTSGRFIVSTIFLYSIRAPLKNAIESDISDEKKEELDKLSMNKFIKKLMNVFPVDMSEKNFHLMFWAGLYGVLTFVASELLQLGMVGASAGKSAFIVGLNVVVIQIVEMMLPEYGTSFSWIVFSAISLSVLGLYFLSGCFDLMFDSSGESCSDVITYYDILVFLSMFGFAFNILLADAGSSRTDCIDLTCLSFLVSTILCILLSVYMDPDTWLSFQSLSYVFSFNTFIVAYTGVAEVSAVTLGVLGQMYLSPTRSALIMSLEATSSAILAYMFLHEVLTMAEMFGCCLMFFATVLSTTHGVDEEEIEMRNKESFDRRVSFETIGQTAPAEDPPFNFAETSDFLESFLVTSRRSLSRGIVLRRSRSERSVECGSPTSSRELSPLLSNREGHEKGGFLYT